MAFNCSTLSQHFCSNPESVAYVRMEETSVDIPQVKKGSWYFMDKFVSISKILWTEL